MAEEKGIILRGRSFGLAELKVIRSLVEEYWEEGRTRISRAVCEALNWRQPNGWLKDRACREVLRRLESMKLLVLPPSRSSSAGTAPYSKWSDSQASIDDSAELAEEPPVHKLQGKLVLKVAKGNEDETRWNRLVDAHHYLGYKVSVGRTLKFLVCDDVKTLGAASLAQAAWAVKVRDEAINKLNIRRSAIANNNRFVIFPYVEIPNLGSQILSALATDGKLAWEKYYCEELLCLETFVDTSRYRGTVYKAANWVEVGSTKGYRKSGSSHVNSQKPKAVFLYPIAYEARSALAKTGRTSARQDT